MPSCAIAKVKVDLLREFQKRSNIEIRKKSGKVEENWVTIKYDCVLKYNKSCKLQEHDEKKYFVIHQKLDLKEDKEEGEDRKKKNSKEEEKDPKNTANTDNSDAKQGEGETQKGKGK